MISFNCSGCQAPVVVPTNLAGKEGTCVQCGALLTIPTGLSGELRSPSADQSALPLFASQIPVAVAVWSAPSNELPIARQFRHGSLAVSHSANSINRVAKRTMPTTALLLFSILLAVGVGGAYYYGRSQVKPVVLKSPVAVQTPKKTADVTVAPIQPIATHVTGGKCCLALGSFEMTRDVNVINFLIFQHIFPFEDFTGNSSMPLSLLPSGTMLKSMKADISTHYKTGLYHFVTVLSGPYQGQTGFISDKCLIRN